MLENLTFEPTIAPSLLSADFGNLATEIKEIEQVGADWLHLDIMDGSFVPPITFGTNVVKLARKNSNLKLDVHLMINHPEQHIEEFIQAGANALSFHYEVSNHAHRLLNQIRSLGAKAGIAVNPGTPICNIFDLLDVCDFVLIMSVNPGWGGQKFIPHSLEKVKILKAELSKRQLTTKIEIDGGINLDTISDAVKQGVDVLVAGNAVFGAKNRKEAFQRLKECC